MRSHGKRKQALLATVDVVMAMAKGGRMRRGEEEERGRRCRIVD